MPVRRVLDIDPAWEVSFPLGHRVNELSRAFDKLGIRPFFALRLQQDRSIAAERGRNPSEQAIKVRLRELFRLA